MKKHTITIILILCSLWFVTHVTAQVDQRTKWETKLETFQRKVGTVLVKGSSHIGTVEGGAGEIHVRAIEYRDTRTGEKERGIEFFITAKSGSHPLIDYDEIDSFVKAIEQMTALDKSATELEKYEAFYRTRGNMTVVLVEASLGNGLRAVVDGNEIGGGIVILSIEGLGNLKRLVAEAKTKLDSLKGAPK